MPGVEFRDRFQTAVLWPATEAVDDYGVLQVSSPQEIQVRWKDELSEQQMPDGSTVTLDGIAKVWQEIAIGSHMWLGTLSQWYGVGSSGDDTEVRVVKTTSQVPDIKNRNQAYTVGLMRWKSNG